MSWSISELWVRLAPWKRFSPPVKYFLLTIPRRYFFCGSFVFFVSCVSHAFASVHCGLVVTCWERADLLALVGDVYCILLLSHVVSWVRCGTWLYRFLILAIFLTLISIKYLDQGHNTVPPVSLKQATHLSEEYQFPWQNIYSFYMIILYVGNHWHHCLYAGEIYSDIKISCFLQISCMHIHGNLILFWWNMASRCTNSAISLLTFYH